MTERTAYVPPADRADAHQVAVDTTAACEVGNHGRCGGTVLSLTSSNGAACACECHHELAVEAALEARHFGSLLDL